MPGQRKLGRATDQRKAVLKGLVTSLFENGRITTTEARAKEVKNIAEKLISTARKEAKSGSSKQVKISAAKVDSDGRKMTVSKESKNGSTYTVVDREVITDMRAVDSSSRLHARRKIMNWVYNVKDKDGNKVKIVNNIFDYASNIKEDRTGGCTRIYKLGPRRGDAAEMVLLELVKDE